MRKFIFLFVFFLFFFNNLSFGHVKHYEKVKYLKYSLFFNENIIGSHNFTFKNVGNLFYVKSDGEFNVSKLGINLMKYSTKSEEIYENGKLIKFTSKTVQNDKKKYVNINIKEKKLNIDGSSFKGLVNDDLLIGSWWNHSIINKKKQISPISGRILDQKVKFLGKKNINLNGKDYKALHFHFLSDDNKSLKKKKLNIQVWYDEKTLIWLKSSYDKIGKWEYRLAEHSF